METSESTPNPIDQGESILENKPLKAAGLYRLLYSNRTRSPEKTAALQKMVEINDQSALEIAQQYAQMGIPDAVLDFFELVELPEDQKCKILVGAYQKLAERHRFLSEDEKKRAKGSDSDLLQLSKNDSVIADDADLRARILNGEFEMDDSNQ